MAESYTLPPILSPTPTTREAVADALYRCVLGLDTADIALFESSLTQDAVFDFNGQALSGLASIRTMYDRIAKLDTTHFISNVRIHVNEDGKTASLTASALAQHYRAGHGNDTGAPRLLTGSLYRLELVKDEEGELWRIKVWRGKSTWMEGDREVMRGD